MKAVSVVQPWAQLIVDGPRRREGRGAAMSAAAGGGRRMTQEQEARWEANPIPMAIDVRKWGEGWSVYAVREEGQLEWLLLTESEDLQKRIVADHNAALAQAQPQDAEGEWGVHDFQPANTAMPIAAFKVLQSGHEYQNYSPDRTFIVSGTGGARRLVALLNALTSENRNMRKRLADALRTDSPETLDTDYRAALEVALAENRALAARAEAAEEQSHEYQTDLAEEWGKTQAAEAENVRLRDAIAKTSNEVEQTLGKALGYPWYKDDPKNFPDATEADGVCVGDHVPESLADEAAQLIARLREQVAALEGLLDDIMAHQKRALLHGSTGWQFWQQFVGRRNALTQQPASQEGA